MPKSVEIKINVVGDALRTLRKLSLSDGDERSVWFLEDLTRGLPTLTPLLSEGVILRLRGNADGTMDSTAKLRPCRMSQLAEPWASGVSLGDDGEYRIEGDWTGSRRVTAASCVAPLTTEAFTAVVGGGDPLMALSPWQLAFLSACASIRVNPSGLRALGPIAATQWKDVEIGGLDARVERWTVGPLDFVELSVQVKETAQISQDQHAFEAAVGALHLTIDKNKDSKTKVVLDHLCSAKLG